MVMPEHINDAATRVYGTVRGVEANERSLEDLHDQR